MTEEIKKLRRKSAFSSTRNLNRAKKVSAAQKNDLYRAKKSKQIYKKKSKRRAKEMYSNEAQSNRTQTFFIYYFYDVQIQKIRFQFVFVFHFFLKQKRSILFVWTIELNKRAPMKRDQTEQFRFGHWQRKCWTPKEDETEKLRLKIMKREITFPFFWQATRDVLFMTIKSNRQRERERASEK